MSEFRGYHTELCCLVKIGLFLVQFAELTIVSYDKEEGYKAYYEPESKVYFNV